MRDITVGAPIVRRMLEGVALTGHSREDLLTAHGISPHLLRNSRLRISTMQFSELTAGIVRLLEDESYGMLEQPMPVGTLDTIFRACFSTGCIGHSLATWARVNNLMPHSLSIKLRTASDTVSLIVTCEKRRGIATDAVLECQLMAVHRFHCWLAKEFFPVARVDFQQPEPAYASEYHFAFYGAPVRYDQEHYAITFDKTYLDLECSRDREELARRLESPPSRILTDRKYPASTTVKLRNWMEKALRDGDRPILLEGAAEYMELSPQTLRRRLKKDGMSFHQLKEGTRRDVAIHLLSAGKCSVEEVAYKAGFSEASTFIRAFKKWTGLTPLSYKRMERESRRPGRREGH